MDNQSVPAAFICILGNDGTGKTTMCNLVNQKTQYIGVQRSMKNSEHQYVRNLVQQIRTIDKLTYSYAFEDDWYNFDISHYVEIKGVKVKVYWVLLTAPTTVLKKRINTRPDMTIYQHQKCIEYFNFVYEEMAHFYGMHLINSDQDTNKTLSDISKIVQKSHNVLAIKNLTLALLNQCQLERNIIQYLTEDQAEQIYDQKVLMQIKNSGMHNFYFPALQNYSNTKQKKMLAAKWIKNHAERQFVENGLVFKFLSGVQKQVQQKIQIPIKHGFLFQKIIEGQSKILHKIVTNNQILHDLFDQKVIILLKSTIYSHTNQHTAQISQLGKIRAKGSMIFLQMLKRNHIKHSYISVNKEGIILSRLVQPNELQIVFKKQCLGTDKHSYIGIKKCNQIVDNNNCYQGGIYIRFDWRNPNHMFLPTPEITLNLDPYYYLVQKIVGKQQFFTKFLSNEKCKPIGDKCISEDVVKQYTNTKKIKQLTIQAYCTFQYYAHAVGLQILDGCMMIDSSCNYIWSQINPDCLRVKSIKQREDYDKDIWRAGGSCSKQLIMKKWQTFNDIFSEYFKKHRFMNSEVVQQLLCKQIFAKDILENEKIRQEYRSIYRNIVRGTKQRQVIATIDIINGQPILVQSSLFKQKHSQANINSALQYISILPQVLLVDIDGASGKPTNNRKLISNLKSNSLINYYAVGGGIRSVQAANSYLQQFQRIVISSNLNIIIQIPQQKRRRIIVQLSINQQNQVLTHARTVNTGINVIQKMIQLCQYGIQIVSITFNGSQGRLQGLPRQQLRKLMYQIPGPIKKVIIAGGISSIHDLQFVWGFPKCVPQLGSAIWKKKILIGQIYSHMVRYDQNQLIPTVIQDKYGKNLGLVYLNQQALIKTCQQRYLYRYSRQHKKLMRKGDQSGNIQKVLSINIDCDNDSLLITIDNEHPIFCHLNTQSCFYNQINKSNNKNFQQLQDHINKSIIGGGSGYSFKVQNSPKLAITKVLEEVQQLSLAENKQRKIQESADVMAHFLMYLNSENIKITQILAQLNKRTKREKKNKSIDPEQQNIIKIGLATGKHTKFLFQFLQEKLGIKILPHTQGKQRNYTIKYSVQNKQQFQNAFKLTNKDKVVFISLKPKDLSKLMYKNYIQFGINYSNVVQNSCDKFDVIAESVVKGLRLALIKRQGQIININNWSEDNKGVIISEYPTNLVNYFRQKNIPSNYYSIIKVSGHSEGFLQNKKFSYCDAIVLSGKTIQDNHLEIQAILKQEIKVILFSLKQ